LERPLSRAVRWETGSAGGISVDARGRTRIDPDTGSTVEQRNGLLIAHLRGTPYQRGLAHGKLLRREILDSGICPYFSGFLEQILRSSGLNRALPPPLGAWLSRLLEWWTYAPLERQLLPDTREELFGVADATELDRRDVVRGVLAPDVMNHLAAGFLRGGKQALGNYYLGGCSAAYVRKTALRGGAPALLARNMDFPGSFVWRHPLLLFAHPEEKIDVLSESPEEGLGWVENKKQPYLYITAAGFPGFGLTGMNASGIAMGTFVCLSKSVSRNEMPSLEFNHYLFTRCESLQGIIHVLEQNQLRSASPHTALFADAREAISVEVDARQNAVRTMPRSFDFHVQTNHFLNPRMKRREMEFPLEREYTIGRFRLLRDGIDENYGRLDVQRMIDLISCNLDLLSATTRLVGDFPAQAITLTSALFEPETGNFWVASGTPPGVCYNRYLGFNFAAELAGKAGERSERSERSERNASYTRSGTPVLRGTRFAPVRQTAKKSLRYLVLSQEELKQGKVRGAIKSLEKAISLNPDPGFEYIRGILYLMDRRPGEALAIFRALKEKASFAPVKSSALLLWEGRSLDLLGLRREAKACYRSALRRTGLVPGLRGALRRSLRRRFRQAGMPRTIEYYLMGPLTFT
jgi:hypothetical protein